MKQDKVAEGGEGKGRGDEDKDAAREGSDVGRVEVCGKRMRWSGVRVFVDEFSVKWSL